MVPSSFVNTLLVCLVMSWWLGTEWGSGEWESLATVSISVFSGADVCGTRGSKNSPGSDYGPH